MESRWPVLQLMPGIVAVIPHYGFKAPFAIDFVLSLSRFLQKRIMEQTLRTIIIIHALLGALGLFTGMLAILTRKGNRLHRTTGKIFAVSMAGSSVLSLVIAASPGHINPFLFLIGVFTLYLILTGYRAIRFVAGNKLRATGTDWLISICMGILAVGMIGIGLSGILGAKLLFVFFGGIGLVLAGRDLKTFRAKGRVNWLSIHISKMVGALIASVTAFIVAGIGIVHPAAWILPTVMGTIYIVRWQRRIRKTG